MFQFSNDVTGEFPPEVVYLAAHLRVLDLGNNVVYNNGTFWNPFLGQMTTLADFRIDRTNFQTTDGVPVEIRNLKNLGYFACTSSLYRGPLNGAAFPSDMAALSVLDIEANTYGNAVPTEIGVLPGLQNFYIRACSMTGNLNYMVNMPKIFQTFVGLNPGLAGPLPDFSRLSTLASISATESGFSGTLPAELGYPGSPMLNMFYFNNSFSGEIPASWGQMNNMTELQVQFNSLSGLVPDSICVLRGDKLGILTADCSNCPSNSTCCTSCA